MTDEIPLIWTNKGNLPIADLEYAYAWEDTPEYMKFTETYSLNGEMVKNSCHVYKKLPAQLGSEQGVL